MLFGVPACFFVFCLRFPGLGYGRADEVCCIAQRSNGVRRHGTLEQPTAGASLPEAPSSENCKISMFPYNKSMKKICCVFFIFMLAGVFSACKKKEQVEYSFFPEENKRLTVFSCIDKKLTKLLVQEFENITGIWVDVFCGESEQVKVLLEECDSPEASKNCDVLLCTLPDSFSMFEKFASAHVKNNSRVPRPFGKKNFAVFSLTPVVFLYNTDFFPEKDGSLMSQFKQIDEISIANPYFSTENFLCLYALFKSQQEFQIKRLSKVYGSFNSAAEAVAEGFARLTVMPENQAMVFMNSYYSFAVRFFLPENAAVIVNAGTILKFCRYRDNAERFMAFLQSRETQNFLHEQHKYRFVRSDMALNAEDWDFVNKSLQNEGTGADSFSYNKTEILQNWLKKISGGTK